MSSWTLLSLNGRWHQDGLVFVSTSQPQPLPQFRCHVSGTRHNVISSATTQRAGQAANQAANQPANQPASHPTGRWASWPVGRQAGRPLTKSAADDGKCTLITTRPRSTTRKMRSSPLSFVAVAHLWCYFAIT